MVLQSSSDPFGFGQTSRDDVPSPSYYGLYRAHVVRSYPNLKLDVRVPKVTGQEIVTALPCLPPGSNYAPPARAMVWVMYENGVPDRAVWIGVGVPVAHDHDELYAPSGHSH